MSRGLAVVALALAGAAVGSADEPLHVRGSEIGSDGVLTRRQAEVVGGADATTTPILVIESPPVHGTAYQVSGRVRCAEVAGEGYIEMWSQFPDGSRYFSRTLDSSGPMAKLSGTAAERSFVLPFQMGADTPPPVRLEVNVVLPGAGRVSLSELRFSGESGGAATRWSPRLGGWLGALGAAIGVAAALLGVRNARRRQAAPGPPPSS
jgi:hypothetical protein